MKFFGLLQELKALPQKERDPGGPLPEDFAPIQVSLLIPARHAADSIEKTVHAAEEALNQLIPGQFEIVIIPNPHPNPRPGTPKDLTEEVARKLSNKYSSVKVAPHLLPPGKGAALRTGFWASKGEIVFFTDADLPYDLRFFKEALSEIQKGAGLITGNRRLPESVFDLPVELLPVAYGRHRLGLLFNRVTRLLFPLQTTDTQAGIKAFTRELGKKAFSLQACPGFFFDIELFLTARHHKIRHKELPVRLYLASEKSTVRLARDAILALFWLLRLSLRNLSGAYQLKPMTGVAPR